MKNEKLKNMKDLCCIGHITRDKIITPKQTVYMAGGNSFYFTYGIRHLPEEVSYQLVTKVGEESMPEIEKMRGMGVDVKCFESRRTVYFENKYGDNPNERTQRVLAKADPFTVEEMEGLDARIYHLGSLLADDFSPEVVRTLSRKGQVSLDVQGYLREVRGESVFPVDWSNKEEILRMTDILKLNEQEMEIVTNSKDPRTVARLLADMGVKEVLITFLELKDLHNMGRAYLELSPEHILLFEKKVKLAPATGSEANMYSSGGSRHEQRFPGTGYFRCGRYGAFCQDVQ